MFKCLKKILNLKGLKSISQNRKTHVYINTCIFKCIYFRCQTQTHMVPTVQQTLSLDSQSSRPPPFLLNSSAHSSTDCHLYAEGRRHHHSGLLGAVHPTSLCSNYIHRGWHTVSPKKTSERRLQDKPLTNTLRFH